MSSTTTPTVNPTVAAVISTLESVVAIAAAGRLTGISTTVDNDVHTYDADADKKIDELQVALDKAENENPTVKAVLVALGNIATATGFKLPAEAAVFAAVKASVDDLAGGLVPATPAKA